MPHDIATATQDSHDPLDLDPGGIDWDGLARLIDDYAEVFDEIDARCRERSTEAAGIPVGRRS